MLCRLVSINHLLLSTPGLIAQMRGILTTKCDKEATVYVDQVLRLSFTYFQNTTTADKTLEGKEAFEKYDRDQGINIQANHLLAQKVPLSAWFAWMLMP